MPYSRYAVVGAKKYRGKSGQHTTNLLDTVKADVKLRNLNLRNTTDLKLLTWSASANRASWRKITYLYSIVHGLGGNQ